MLHSNGMDRSFMANFPYSQAHYTTLDHALRPNFDLSQAPTRAQQHTTHTNTHIQPQPPPQSQSRSQPQIPTLAQAQARVPLLDDNVHVQWLEGTTQPSISSLGWEGMNDKDPLSFLPGQIPGALQEPFLASPTDVSPPPPPSSSSSNTGAGGETNDLTQGGITFNNGSISCWNHGCKGRTFSTVGNYRRHIRELSRLKTFSCRRCGRLFSRSTARDLHYEYRRCKLLYIDNYGLPCSVSYNKAQADAWSRGAAPTYMPLPPARDEDAGQGSRAQVEMGSNTWTSQLQ